MVVVLCEASAAVECSNYVHSHIAASSWAWSGERQVDCVDYVDTGL